MPKTRPSKRTRSRICTRAQKGDKSTSNRLQGFAQTLSTGTNTGTSTGGASVNVSYQYDANGALRQDGLRSYEFDAANRLADVTTGSGIDAPTTRYVHNALGQRLFKTEPLYAPVSTGSNPADPGVIQTLRTLFSNLWGGNTTTATPSTSEKLGYQYYYDEDGNLLSELGAGGAQSTGSAHYVSLPTPSGPMPIAAVINAKQYAVHTDHLNTPRRLTQSDKRVAWQWAFSAFGDEQPTTGKNRYVDPVTTPNAGSTTIADVTFNLRYPGQYFDKESGLHYNYFRSYDARNGRYTQSDPIDLAGGWNKYSYVEGNPLSYTDPMGLICTYSQSTGAMSCTNSVGQNYYNANGYAGTGTGRNNPDAQGQQNVGPLTRGQWEVTGSWRNSPNTGRNTVNLTPLPGNDCAASGRDCASFRIHGNNARNDASHGCIVLPPNRIIIPIGEIIEVTR